MEKYVHMVESGALLEQLTEHVKRLEERIKRFEETVQYEMTHLERRLMKLENPRTYAGWEEVRQFARLPEDQKFPKSLRVVAPRFPVEPYAWFLDPDVDEHGDFKRR